MQQEEEMVTPGEVLGKPAEVKPGKGAYLAPYCNTKILYVYSQVSAITYHLPLTLPTRSLITL